MQVVAKLRANNMGSQEVKAKVQGQRRRLQAEEREGRRKDNNEGKDNY